MSFDFTKAFGFVFEDNNWIVKALAGAGILLGAQMLRGFIAFGFQLLSAGMMAMGSSSSGSLSGFSGMDWTAIAIQGLGQLLALALSLCVTFIVWGYLARTFRNVVGGYDLPMAEWGDWMEDFFTGAKIFFISFVYGLPVFAVSGALIAILAGTQMGASSPDIEEIMAAIGALGFCGIGLVTIGYFLVLPAPLMRFAATRQMRAAFELGPVMQLIFKNIGVYLLAVITAIAAMFLSGLGILLLCVGVFATRFWGYLITTHAFAQVYRIAFPDEIALHAPPDSPLSPQTAPPAHTG